MSSETTQQSSSLHFLDYWRVIRSRKEIVLAVAILVVITGTVYTLLLPNIYESSVRIRVSEDSPEINPFAQQTYYSSYNPYFLRDQFEIIQSKPIFTSVINRLNLQEGWGESGEKVAREVALKILANSISVIQQRDTSLIMIVVRRDDPDESARIANEIAEVYRDSRLEIASKQIRDALNKMKEELTEQADRVLVAEATVQAVRVKYGIATPGGEGSADYFELQIQQLQADRTAAQQVRVDKEVALSVLEKIKPEDLVDSAAGITQDPNVISLVQQLQDIKVQLSSIGANFGPNHPEVKRLKNQQGQVEKTLTEQLIALRKRLKTEFDVASSRFVELEKLLDDAKKETIELQGQQYQEFRQALADLDNERFIYNQLNARLRQEMITMDVPRHPVEIIDAAEPNRRPVSPNLFMNVLLSIFVGLGAGVGLAYFIEYLDTSVKTAEDIERILGLPVLGLIPQKVRPLIEEGPDSEHAESYRVLRTNLAFSEGGAHHGAFCVLSGGAGEGKSTTCFNLAFVCAQQGEKVLLIDADLRRPVQHTILGVSNRFGLTNVLLRDVPVEEAIKATSVPNLHFLPSGRLPRTSLGVLDPKRIRELIGSLKTKYDVVLIDTPPLVGISDSAIIAKEADGAVIVVQYRKYPREMLNKARQTIESLGVKVVGAVLNNINVMRDDYYYYYHSYYSDYYRSSQSEMSEGNDL
ncbi:MAG: polysaccharide biosynthesis tyrosine autokinase [Pontiellaceae bacterium]|nr:polysaccharide biosynthesis tyrosine autokinase [Pontiellaceae bacterium]